MSLPFFFVRRASMLLVGHRHKALRRILVLCFVVFFRFTTFLGFTSSSTNEHGLDPSDPCYGWQPELPHLADPPTCLRAKQWRQLEALTDRQLFEVSRSEAIDHNINAITAMKRCVLGMDECPERPMILGGWWYLLESVSAQASSTGEVIWLKSVIEHAHLAGYQVVPTYDYNEMVKLSKILPDLIHQVWAEDTTTISCVSDPRCIADGHYRPPQQHQSLLAKNKIPDNELGVIPIWRLHAVNFWGSRPTRHDSVGFWWGFEEDKEWSFSPLGQEWTFTPFAYPNHTHLPMSIEKTCTKLPVLSHEKKDDNVLIFAKESSYFHRENAPSYDKWDNIVEFNPDIHFMTASKVDHTGDTIPPALTNIGWQTREHYDKIAGSAKVMLGIGWPRISPSVFTSLCQATPVVLPVHEVENMEAMKKDAWYPYMDAAFQHGPAMLEGEPYVYHYSTKNTTDMLRQIRKAIATPIGRYIPEDMKYDNAYNKIRDALEFDWEHKFRQVVKANGGDIPQILGHVYDRGWELKRLRAIAPGSS